MGRIALVTGASKGIGAACAEGLKAAGYKVAVNYGHNEATAKAFTEKSGIPSYKWDVANFDACKAGVEKVQQDLGGPIEVLVNNAGITRDVPMHKMTFEQWNEVIQVNLTSCFNMSRLVIEGMRERNFGRIISISSVNGQLGQYGQVNYCAAKAGIIGFTKSLARETANKGITVNTVAPGYVDTDMVRSVREDILKKIIDDIPVKRLGVPHDIARAVVFLAADETSFITGETMSVNGGQYMQ